jgi:formylglycine-generating enzyme required for sulfatase activity
MKKLLITPLLFACYMSIGQTESSAFIIGKPIKFKNILVAQNDFPNYMNWYEAMAACKKLGKGWRLPSRDELQILFQNRVQFGGFSNKIYWSSSEWYDKSAWIKDLINGGEWSPWKGLKGNPDSVYVRAVRSL